MTIYIANLILFYLIGVTADYKTTMLNIAAGKDEINPMMKKSTRWRVLVPFLYAIPVLMFSLGVEYTYLADGQYVNTRASLVYETENIIAQMASLIVFFMLIVGSSKAVASISNIFIIYFGKGLPDLVGYVIGWNNTTTIFLVTSFMSLIFVVPLVYVVRYISFSLML